jgi:hypothetical protein
LKNLLTVDDVDLIIAVVEDASEDILQRHEAKQETLYEIIEKELKDIQQAIYSSRTVPIVPSASKIAKLGKLERMARRRYRVEETRSIDPGGATVGIHCARTDENFHCNQEDEKIIGTAHNPVEGYYHPGQSYGGYIDTPSSAG